MRKAVRVGDLCDLVNGRAFKPTDWSAAGAPIIRIQNLNDSLKPFNYWAGPLERQVLVSPGDLLLAWSGTPGTSFGAHIWNGPSGILNQHIFRVDLDETRVRKDWFVYALNNKLDELIGMAHGGVGLKHVTRGMVDGLVLLLPPLDEQRRIAAILDQADALRRKRSDAILKFDQLRSAIFKETFGDPVQNERGWRRVRFRELLSAIESGSSPVCLDRPALPNEWGVLKLSAVTSCRFDEGAQKALPIEDLPAKRLEVRAGDLLFTRKNTLSLVGACAIVRRVRSQLLLPDLIFRLALRSDAPVVSEYLYQLLTTPSKRVQIQSLAGGSAGSMPNISKAKLEDIEIELPPTELQMQFKKTALLIERMRQESMESREHFDLLFSSLQEVAFKADSEFLGHVIKEAAE